MADILDELLKAKFTNIFDGQRAWSHINNII
jgi:hypothetical protein